MLDGRKEGWKLDGRKEGWEDGRMSALKIPFEMRGAALTNN